MFVWHMEREQSVFIPYTACTDGETDRSIFNCTAQTHRQREQSMSVNNITAQREQLVPVVRTAISMVVRLFMYCKKESSSWPINYV